MSESLSIEVVSDVVCPWCYIGTERLHAALSAARVEADVRFLPFLLAPSVPDEGADLREWLGQRYGDPEPMFRRVEAVAKESGVTIDFSRVRKHASTVRAHTLLRHAHPRGTQPALARDLFAAYFGEGRDVGAMDVLVELGGRHGFEASEVITLLESPTELDRTRVLARPPGISGVPFTLVGRKGAPEGAKRFAIKGAQPVEVFQAAIERALAEA